MSEDEKRRGRLAEDRLPPPAFPPGARRRRPMLGHPGVLGRVGATGGGAPAVGSADAEAGDASGAEVARGDAAEAESFPEGAYITPEEAARKIQPRRPEPGVATGIGIRRSSFVPVPVPEAEDVDFGMAADVLERLAQGLRKKGSLALLVGPDMNRFEAVLRGFLAGYLGGMGTDPED